MKIFTNYFGTKLSKINTQVLRKKTTLFHENDNEKYKE